MTVQSSVHEPYYVCWYVSYALCMYAILWSSSQHEPHASINFSKASDRPWYVPKYHCLCWFHWSCSLISQCEALHMGKMMCADMFHIPCRCILIYGQASNMSHMLRFISPRPQSSQDMCQNIILWADFGAHIASHYSAKPCPSTWWCVLTCFIWLMGVWHVLTSFQHEPYAWIHPFQASE